MFSNRFDMLISRINFFKKIYSFLIKKTLKNNRYHNLKRPIYIYQGFDLSLEVQPSFYFIFIIVFIFGIIRPVN
jgi:hypothetical protein